MLAACALLATGVRTDAAEAEVRLASIFQDHAVLQRELPVPVWGTANPGEKVSVSFHGQEFSAIANSSGEWNVVLAPMPASADGAELTASSAGRVVARIEDILVGEVWLCSGQSNMEWNVARAADAEREIAAANFSSIRAIKIGNASELVPATAIASGSWKVCSPKTVGNFTAVGYHFARELHEALAIPVGIVDATWGGTPIEAWMSEESLLSDPKLAVVFERWAKQIASFPERRKAALRRMQKWEEEKAAASAAGRAFDRSPPADFWSVENRVRPMGLYGGMIAPVIPYAIRGAAWYQGENNAGQADYQTELTALIADWRARWHEGNFPFLIVQLPNYASGNAEGEAWARTREAQALTAAVVPNAGLAVTIEQGERDNVHPKQKREVAHRLALLALNKTYHRSVECMGPVFRDADFSGASVRVRFSHADGLRADGGRIPGFEVAGEDRKFFPADAVIDGETVSVISSRVPAPVAVRYAWCNAPVATLRNAAGLPAAPFRSDTW